jgi:4-amino-4-deoxy-L-arabinose transferase-like glycosyltransferase
MYRYSKASAALGTLLILSGIFVSSSELIELLRPGAAAPEALREQLLTGAAFFKVGLATLGLVMMGLGLLPIWHFQNSTETALPKARPKTELILIAAILLLALALRLYQLNSGLWYDEIVMYVNYMHRPLGEILTTYDFQNQHFLYTLLTRLSLTILGESNWALRAPAVLFGVGSIGALYLLARQLVSPLETFLSMALLTVSYHHIWFSQNARGYIGLLFWTIVCSWLLLRGIREDRPGLWLFYAVAAALGVFTHMTMLFVIAGHFIIYLITLFNRRRQVWPGRWLGLFLGFGLSGLLTLQLYALVLPQVLSRTIGEEKEGSLVGAWANPFWTLLEFTRSLQLSLASGIVAIIGLLVFGIGFFILARRNPVIVQLLIFPVLIAALVTIGLGHHVWPRLFFFAGGFAVIIAIHGMMLSGEIASRLFSLGANKAVLIGGLLSGVLILASALSIPLVYGPKQDYDAALAFIEARKAPDDGVVMVGLAAIPYRLYYKVDWAEVETVEELNTMRSQFSRTWLVYTLSVQLNSLYPEVMETIQQDFVIAEQFPGTLGDGTIFIYQSSLPSATNIGSD